MPVKFKGRTEYIRNYKPFQSHKSASFTPAMEQKARSAGVPFGSPDRSNSEDVEPAFQRKKRVAAPVTSLSTDFFEGSSAAAEDDYVLLGNNEKFTNNIKYRNRNTNNPKNVGAFNFRDASPPKIQKIKLHTEPVLVPAFKAKEGVKKKPETMSKIKKSKDHGPVVDTSKFKTPLKRPSNPSKRKVPSNQQAKVSTESKPEATSEVTPTYGLKYKAGIAPPRPKGPMRLSEYQREFEWKKGSRSSPLLIADQSKNNTRTVPPIDASAVKSALKKQSETQEPAQPTEAAGTAKANEAARPAGRPTRQQEAALPAKPTIQSQQKQHSGKVTKEAWSKKTEPVQEIANVKKPKPGVNHSRLPQGPLTLSEYQREFEWKQAIRPSPLLNAEKAKDMKKTTSEENRHLVTPDLKKSAEQAKSERTKFELHKPDIKEKEPMQESCVKKTDEEGKISHKPKHAPKLSEYQVAFSKNKRNKTSQSLDASKKVEEDADPMGLWLRNVMELRQKAEEYRNRSQGTHFSREHLVQLMAQQNELWDLSPLSSEMSSSHRDVISDDVEDLSQQDASEGGDVSMVVNLPDDSNNNRRSKKPIPANASKHVAKQLFSKRVQNEDSGSNKCETPLSDEPDQTSEQLTPSTVSRSSVSSIGKYKPKSGKPKRPTKTFKKPQKSVMAAWGDQNKTNNNKKVPESVDEFDEDEGRIPTPTLRRRSMSEMVRRHHLDRTTPSVGGAILTSLPSSKLISASSPELDDQSSDTLVDWEVPKAAEPVIPEPTPDSKTFDVRNIRESPTFGRPSYDSHVLRDDLASEDRPLVTRYVDTPLRHSASDFHLSSDNSKVKDCPRPSFVPPTLREGMGMTYMKPDQSNIKSLQKPFSWSLQGGEFVPRCDDDDILSISARSVASSSSLASAVLERARRRQQNVWG